MVYVTKCKNTLSIKAETSQYFFKSIQIFQKMKFGIATLIILGLVLTIEAIPQFNRQGGSSEEESGSSEEEGGPGVTTDNGAYSPTPKTRSP